MERKVLKMNELFYNDVQTETERKPLKTVEKDSNPYNDLELQLNRVVFHAKGKVSNDDIKKILNDLINKFN